MVNQYILTREIYQRIIGFKKSKLFCKKCLQELKIGDCVKSNINSGTAKLYHCKCYDELFLEVED